IERCNNTYTESICIHSCFVVIGRIIPYSQGPLILIIHSLALSSDSSEPKHGKLPQKTPGPRARRYPKYRTSVCLLPYKTFWMRYLLLGHEENFGSSGTRHSSSRQIL